MDIPKFCRYCDEILTRFDRKDGRIVMQCLRCGGAYDTGIELDAGTWFTPLFATKDMWLRGKL